MQTDHMMRLSCLPEQLDRQELRATHPHGHKRGFIRPWLPGFSNNGCCTSCLDFSFCCCITRCWV